MVRAKDWATDGAGLSQVKVGYHKITRDQVFAIKFTPALYNLLNPKLIYFDNYEILGDPERCHN